jgi:hypothetical protein
MITGTKTYIYGVIDTNNNIIYIGKSSCPAQRLRHHKASIGYSKAKIIDIFFDTENYWIQKLKSEGCTLANKYDIPDEEQWAIGDIIEISNLKKIRVKNIQTNIIYDTIQQAADSMGIDRNILASRLRSKTNKTPFIFI